MHQLDLLPVGAGKLSGDAFVLRFARPDTGAPAHVVIDAGYAETGPEVVDHVRRVHGTERLELAILTHPDPDHAGGMATVLRELEVERLWIHDLVARGGERSVNAAAVRELLTIARERGIPVEEPFTGTAAFGGALRVLGPDPAFYAGLVGDEIEGRGPERAPLLVRAWQEAWEAVTWRLPFELPFGDFEGTSPANNSSLILLLDLPGFRALLPADAGVPALERAWAELERLGEAGRPFDLVVVPHHGSKRNATSELLDRLVGPVGGPRGGPAYISAAIGSPWHPSARTRRAYERRGREVSVTAGRVLRHAED